MYKFILKFASDGKISWDPIESCFLSLFTFISPEPPLERSTRFCTFVHMLMIFASIYMIGRRQGDMIKVFQSAVNITKFLNVGQITEQINITYLILNKLSHKYSSQFKRFNEK